MDLERIAPIIEDILKKVIEEKRYQFGFGKFSFAKVMIKIIIPKKN